MFLSTVRLCSRRRSFACNKGEITDFKVKLTFSFSKWYCWGKNVIQPFVLRFVYKCSVKISKTNPIKNLTRCGTGNQRNFENWKFQFFIFQKNEKCKKIKFQILKRWNLIMIFKFQIFEFWKKNWISFHFEMIFIAEKFRQY